MYINPSTVKTFFKIKSNPFWCQLLIIVNEIQLITEPTLKQKVNRYRSKNRLLTFHLNQQENPKPETNHIPLPPPVRHKTVLQTPLSVCHPALCCVGGDLIAHFSQEPRGLPF